MDEHSGATGHDMSRQGATDPDTEFTLTLEEAATLYARAGHPRTLRSLQRYCGNGHLDARKIQTSLGDKYLVSRQSVARHILQIEELNSLDNVATGRGFSRHVATSHDTLDNPEEPGTPGATGHDMPASDTPTTSDTARPVATVSDTPTATPTTGNDSPRQEPAATPDLSRYVERLEMEVEQAKDERDFLREQIDRKDKTIDSLLERDKETNYLIRGLQNLFPRLGSGQHEPPQDPPTHQQ